MKYLPLLPILAFAISLPAQTTNASGTASAAGDASAEVSHAAAQTSAATNAGASSTANTQAGQAAASAAEATNISAELTKKIDTKNARVGDEVLARTTSAATLSDGTKLPRGTKLIGRVTEVQPRSKAEKASHLAFELDHAVLRGGREVPVHAVLTSMTAVSALASADDDVSMPPVAAGGGAQGGVRSGGGLLGGAGRTLGGAVGGAANTAGEVGGAVRSDAGSALNETQAAGSVATNAGASAMLEHVPVTNMPGVTLSSSESANNSGALDASGKNIDLESGTRMSLNVAAGQQ